jgi:CRISPR type IV-associated protein Csf3
MKWKVTRIQNLQQLIQNKISAYQYPTFYFEPLKITFVLGAPTFLSYPWISFDGLIAHLFSEEVLEEVFRLLPLREPMNFVADLSLPLKKVIFCQENEKTDFIYAASVSQFIDPTAVSTQTLHRTFNTENCVRESLAAKKKIDIVRGQYKLYSMKLPVQYSPVVNFYCSGDKTMLMKLCSQVQGLGKHRGVGGGNVVSFTIEKVAEDNSIIYKDRVMRALPLAYCKENHISIENRTIAQLAYKPPFWDKSQFKLCVSPEID